MAFNIQTYNVVMLGLAFMLIFSAFQTSSNIEQTVIKSVPNFNASGFTSLAIIYGVFALANWVAPSIVAVAGAKLSMILGGIIYTLFIAVFIFPLVSTLYGGSVLLGLAAAIIWTGQGNFLTDNSTEETMGRNSGLFWAIFQSSQIFGNLFVYFEFKGAETIERNTRIVVYTVLAATSAGGVALLMFLLTPNTNELPTSVSDDDQPRQIQNANRARTRTSPLAAFNNSLNLFRTTNMLLLSLTFFYTGVELTFFSGVYGTSIGNTLALGTDSKGLIGISGMILGAGEILGGLVFGILGSRTVKNGRELIVLLGFVIHSVAFYLIYINIPNDAPIKPTMDVNSLMSPNKFVTLSCSFLLGFGDACYNTQLYSILGHMYPESKDSAPAFAIFKFVQSFAAMIGFFYSDHITLTYQLGILVVFNVVGVWAFVVVEGNARSRYVPLTQECHEEGDYSEAHFSAPVKKILTTSIKNSSDFEQ